MKKLEFIPIEAPFIPKFEVVEFPPEIDGGRLFAGISAGFLLITPGVFLSPKVPIIIRPLFISD